MKAFIRVVLVSLFLGNFVMAANYESSTESLANIKKGNWHLGGGFSFSQDSDGERAETSLDALAAYFIDDYLILGGSLDLDAAGGHTYSSFGPVVGYYFAQGEKWAAWLRGDYLAGLTSETVNSSIGTRLGLSVFLTPSVALGPTVFYRHYMGEYGNWSRFGLLAGFGIYL